MKSQSQGTDIFDFLASVGRHTVAKVTYGCSDLPIQEPECSNVVFVEDTGELEQTFGAGWEMVTSTTKAKNGKETDMNTGDGWNHLCAQGNDPGWGGCAQEDNQNSGWETTIATATEGGQGIEEQAKDSQAGWGIRKKGIAESGSTCTQKDDSGWRISPQKDDNSCGWGVTDTDAGWGGQETAAECGSSCKQRARAESENVMIGKGTTGAWGEEQPVADCEAGWDKGTATEEKDSGWGNSPQNDRQNSGWDKDTDSGWENSPQKDRQYSGWDKNTDSGWGNSHQKDGKESALGVMGSEDGWGADKMVTDAEAEWGPKQTLVTGAENGWGSISGQAPGTGCQNSQKMGSADFTENMSENERCRGKFGPSGSNTVPLERRKAATSGNDGWGDEQVVEGREPGWGCEEKEDNRWSRKNVGGWGNEVSRGDSSGQGSHKGKVGGWNESAGGWIQRNENAGGWGSKGNVGEGNGGWGRGNKACNPGGRGSKWGSEEDVENNEANERRSGTFVPTGSNIVPLGKRKTMESKESRCRGDDEEGGNTQGWGMKPKISVGNENGWGNVENVSSEGGWGNKQAPVVGGWDCTESSIDMAASAGGSGTKTSGPMAGSDMMQLGEPDAAVTGGKSTRDFECGKTDRCHRNKEAETGKTDRWEQSEDQTGWVSFEQTTHGNDGSGWTSSVLDEGRNQEQDGQKGPSSYGGWNSNENGASLAGQSSKTMHCDDWRSKPVGGEALADKSGWGSKAPSVHNSRGNGRRFVQGNTGTGWGGTNPRDYSHEGRKFGFHKNSRSTFAPNSPQGRRPRLKALLNLPEYSELNELVKGSNKILHGSGYEPGNKLLPEDEKFVLEKILVHHPDKEVKFGCGVDHLIVDSHADHQVRCFWVVRKDGSKTDFSYWKCLETLFEREYTDLATKETPPGIVCNQGTTSAAQVDTEPPQAHNDGW